MRPDNVPSRTKLTNAYVRNRLPFATDGQYAVSDTAQTGFRVIVGKGSKTYAVQIEVMRNGERKTIKHKIGDAFEWDCTAARQSAEEFMVAARGNKSALTTKREAVTLGAAWADYRRWLAKRVQAGERSSRSLDACEDHMERLLADWLGRSLREIGEAPEMVARRHEDLSEAHGPYQANRVMETLRAVYNSALKRRLAPGITPVSPTSMVDWNIEARRNTGMTPDELRTWAKQLRKMQNHVRREFHLFMLLSAMRPDALKRAKWAHIDRKRRVLHVPKPKGGARRAFDLPLSRDMIRSLARVRRAGRLYGTKGDEWIFPSDAPDGHIAHHKERRNVLSHWGGDLRQTFRGMAVHAGVDELFIRILMNHALSDVSTGYLTLASLLGPLRDAQERVSAKTIQTMGLPDLAKSFKRDIAAKAQSALTPDPKQAGTLEARRRFLFSGDRP